jgi:ketosteroid isomerase-like protein
MRDSAGKGVSMERRRLRSILACACALSTFAAFPATDSKAEQEVRALSAQEVQAFLGRDREKLAALWADDFVVTNPLNQLVDKRQVLGMIDSGMLVLTSLTRQVELARVYGDMVILIGSEDCVWGGKMPMAGKPSHLRFTAMWMKRGGRWQEAVRHANVVPPRQ